MTTQESDTRKGAAIRRSSARAVARPRRRDWGRLFARAICALLALLGTAPFAATLVVRSHWARAWGTRETERLLRQQGLDARYEMSLRIWPLAIELTAVRLDAKDGGGPALQANRVRVRPKLFALLAGRLAIDEVDVDEPRVRVVVRDGKLVNLTLPHAPPSSGPARIPFETFTLTDAAIDADIEGTRVVARAVDLDLTSDDDPAGPSLESALRAGRTEVRREREGADGARAVDDDVLCSVEARVRVQPNGVIVRRLEASGAADFDPAPGTPAVCGPSSEDRLVQLSLGNVHVLFPSGFGGRPRVDGHVAARVPVRLAERAVALPETDGWVRVDLDGHFDDHSVLPDLAGTIEAHDLRLDRYSFAKDVFSELTLRRNVIESPRTTIHFAKGTVVLTDTVLEPLARGVRLEKTRVDIANVDFTDLMRALGVHPNAHVGWDLRQLEVPLFGGTLVPLKLDGELSGRTYSFGVYDRSADDPSRERVFGVSEAQIAAHVSVRPDALIFADVRAILPHSRVDGAFVSLGFNNKLRVDTPHVSVDLDDVSPIGPVVLQGRLEAAAHVGGLFSRPEPEGDIQRVGGLVISDMTFGDVTAGHVTVDVDKPEVRFSGVKAVRRTSTYEVPTATLRFGVEHGFLFDAVAASGGFGFRDLLSVFALDGDPRFDGLDASLATRASVHVALGGPEDVCGGGYVAVDAKSQLANVTVYGERFVHGDADLSLRWQDRERGIAGADVDVRSFVLDKIHGAGAVRATGPAGVLLGSAAIRRGGALTANLMFEGVPMSRVDALGDFGREVEGTVSGVANATGNLDDFEPDAGIFARAELDVAGARVHGVGFPASHAEIRLTHRFTPPKRAFGHTRCGAPIGPPFDKAAYLADTSSHEEWSIDGDLLGGTAQLRDVVFVRGKSPKVTGRASLRGLDLGALTQAFVRRRSEGEEAFASPVRSSVEGQLWGELVAQDVAFDNLSKARLSFLLGPTVISSGGQKFALQPMRQPLELANDRLTVPPLELTLETRDGFQGGCVLEGDVTRVSTNPQLALEARLKPLDLAILSRIFPKVESATGTLVGGIRVTGRADEPTLSGELKVSTGALEVHGLPSAISDVHLDVTAATGELAFSGSGKFAGGTVDVRGTLPIRGLALGTLDASVVGRGMRLTPSDGIAATFDTDLDVSLDPKGHAGSDSSTLPHVTGDVTLASFEYTRPISLTTDLTALGGRAKRTQVATYDPSLDFITFDVRLKSRTPLVIKNNLVEAQLGIDSGALEVTGTNQRLGLRGVLRALPGGRFHFQQSDFEVRQGLIRFEDPTRVSPNVDVTAVTEYRRYNDTAGTGVATGGGASGASIGSTRGGSLWRITLRAYGDADDLRVDMTSEPSLSEEDIVLLLAVGMTRAELDQVGQLQPGSLGASLALNYLGATSGADRAVKQALPIIDDFRFGSAYSTVTGKTEPQLTVGKRLTNDVRASVTTDLSGDRELRSNIEWRLNNQLSVQGSYDNINDVSSSALGNLGVDLRYRLEFE